MQMNGSFDASTVQPQQSVGAHPVGNFPFTISNTLIKPTKDNSGGMFEVEFTTPAGVISTRYNLWNQSPQAVEIAQKQLSALCHATGIFKLDWQNEGAALRGGRGTLEVAQQKNNPEYVEVRKVFDVNGNEPGKPAQQGAAVQPAQQQQPAGNQWGQPANNPAPSTQWGAPQQANPQPTQQIQPQAGWSQQPAGNSAAPPWANNK